MRKLLVLLNLIAFVATASSAAPARDSTAPAQIHGTSASNPRSIQEVRQTLAFEPNRGQDASDAKFIARSGGYLARLSSGRISLVFPRAGGVNPLADRDATKEELNLTFRDARADAALEGEQRLQGVADYFPTGNPVDWKTNVPTYGRVQYRALYPGIDLAFYGTEGRLEYDVDVAPGADSAQVKLAVDGTTEAQVNAAGELVLKTDGREMRFLKPVAYQVAADGTRQPVVAEYRLKQEVSDGKAGDTIAFEVGTYDHARELVIDPVLVYGEFVVSPYGQEFISAIAADAAGNVYLAGGQSYSQDFIEKLDPQGNLLFVAQFAPNYASISGIAIDSADNIYVTGQANPDAIPTTSDAYQQTDPGNNANSYFLQLKADGSAVTYATYFGGTLNGSYASSLAVDSQGKVYLTGDTRALDFPFTKGSYSAAPTNANGNIFGWVAKFDPTLSGAASLVYSTALLATNSYSATVNLNAIAVDSTGEAYVTMSVSGPGFPVTPGSFNYVDNQDGGGGTYVAKLNQIGSALVYSAHLGSGTGNAIAVDGAGSAYVTGQVGYTDQFPTTSGAWQTTYPGAFAAKLSADGSSLNYSTFLNGPSYNPTETTTPFSISIPPGCAQSCIATVSGETFAPILPLSNQLQSFGNGDCGAFCGAAFIEQISSGGSEAVFSSYFSGVLGYFGPVADTNDPSFVGAAVDGNGNIYFAGNGYYGRGGTAPDLPLTGANAPNGFAYLAKIGPANDGLLLFAPNSVNFSTTQSVGVGTAQFGPLPTVLLRNMGSAPVTLQRPFTFSDPEFTETDNCPATLTAGAACTLTLTYTPTAAGSPTATLTALGNSSALSAVLQLSGYANAANPLVVSPGGIAFGDQVTGTAGAAQTVTLTNQSTSGLYIGAISIGNFNNADGTAFPETNNCPSALNSGQSCTVSIQFSPTQLGYATASLATYQQGNIAGLSGAGIAAAVNGSGILALSTNLLNFGSLPDGQSPSPYLYSEGSSQGFYVTNIGTVPIEVTSVTVTMTSSIGSPGDFQLQNSNYLCFTIPFALAPGSNGYPDCAWYNQTPFEVVFQPSAVGLETAEVSVVSSASATPQTISVSGMGVAATQVLVPLSGLGAFGNQPVGYSSAGEGIAFVNQGTVPLTIIHAYTTGDFQITGQGGCQTIPPSRGGPSSWGGSCNFLSEGIVFTPVAAGVRNGTLTLIDSNDNSYMFPLIGYGTAPSGNNVVASPDGLTFTTQAKGTTSGAQLITIANPGDTAVTVNSLSFTGDFSLEPSTRFGCSGTGYATAAPFTINPWQSCTGIPIVFTPTQSSGTESGSLVIGTSAGNTTVSLSGIAAAATQAVGLTPTSVSFGNVQQGTTLGGSNEYLIWIRNAGTEPLTLSSLPVITGNGSAPATDFTFTALTCNATFSNPTPLEPGQSCSIAVSFTPSTTAVESATLTLNDTAGSQTVALSGTGFAALPAVQVDPITLAFDQETIGTAAPVTTPVYLYNNGANSLTIVSDSITAGSGDFLIASGSDYCSGQVIQSGSSCVLKVTFQPGTAGLRTGTLTFKDQGNNLYTVTLAGYANAVVDQASIDPEALAFLPQLIPIVNYSQLPGAQIVTLTNTGNLPITVGSLTGTNVQMSGVNTGDFAINQYYGYDSCSGQTVAAGANCAVGVGFLPAAVGAKTGSLTFPVTYQDETTTNLTVNLSGSGYGSADSAVLNPTQVSFLDQVVSNPGSYGLISETISLTNTGYSTLCVGQLSTNSMSQLVCTGGLSGTNTIVGSSTTGDFVAASITDFGTSTGGYDSCSGQFIAPGSYCNVGVEFAPATAGARTGTITFPVTYSDSTTASFVANLSGNGIAVANGPLLAPGNLVFPAAVVGGNVVYQEALTLYNYGNANFTIGNLTGTNFGTVKEFTFGALGNGCLTGTVLSLGQSCTVNVAFAPVSTGTRSGTLIFPITYAGASTAVNLTATLSGTALAPNQEIQASQSPLIFPSTVVFSSSSPLNLFFSNRGTTSYTVNSIAITGADAADFAISSNGCTGQALAGNSSCTVQIAFTPGAAGARTAILTETDTAPGSPRTILLQGNGLQASQNITFTPLTTPVNFGVAPFTLVATGGASGNPVTFSIVSGPGALSGTNNSVLTITGVGTIVIAANQAGNSNYTAAAPVTQSIVVQTPPLAVLSSPTPGSNLAGPSVTFNWSTVSGVTGYFLHLGTTGVGSLNLLNSAEYSASTTSASVNNLPVNGMTIYARLFTDYNGTHFYQDYVFMASGQAVLTLPGTSGTLAGPTVTFGWSLANGSVNGYFLHLGTTGVGSENLLNSAEYSNTTTSVTVNNLPVNGETIYARVFTDYNGTHLYQDYVFTASALAGLTLPSTSGTLAGPAVTFGWSPAIGSVNGYFLHLGTTGAGSENLLNSVEYPTSTTSVMVKSLPVNGETIYARMFTDYNGTHLYKDYTFTASAQAGLTLPGTSGTLAGPTVTFGWSAATGSVSGYFLHLGTTGVGSQNLLNSTEYPASTTSVVLNGLPLNGETIYARVFTDYNGTHLYKDYTFTAAKQALLTSPLQGATLGGATVTFKWSAATGGVSGYFLHLGTSGPGSLNLLNSAEYPTSTTSVTVNNLPVNGGTIYARVFTDYNGVHVYEDYTFTAQ